MGISKKESHRWQRLQLIPVPEFEALIVNTLESSRELTTAAFLQLANEFVPKNGAQAVPQWETRIVTDLEQLKGQRFGCIYADPPWKYQNQGTRAATNNHYGTQTVEYFCSMPIRELAADKAHLHLWTTNAFLFECPKIFAAWGFEFKSSFVWVKPQMGIGNYWRNAHEIMLLGVRGGQTALSRSELSWVNVKRGNHSAKPRCVRTTIERLSPGPRLELFGRYPVEGWTVFGNQIADDLLIP